MGAVTFSIDPRLINTLKRELPYQTFVETGTFRGETIEFVKNEFNHIYSIELSEKYYQDSLEKFKNDSHVSLIHGDSAAALTSIMPQIQHQPTIFWLDAHWCVAENTGGQSSQCPLLNELSAIKQLNADSIVIIDDARLFLSAPPAPHEISDWPSFDSIVRKLYSLSDAHKLIVVNDCILFFPESLDTAMQKFAHHYGIDWLQVLDKSRDYDKLLIQIIDKENQLQKIKRRNQKIKAVFKWLVLPFTFMMALLPYRKKHISDIKHEDELTHIAKAENTNA